MLINLSEPREMTLELAENHNIHRGVPLVPKKQS